MITCILIFVMLFVLYKLVMKEPIPYLDKFLENRETFKVSAWDGRGTDYKKCLNSIEGVRHYYYRDASSVCDRNDPFNKYL